MLWRDRGDPLRHAAAFLHDELELDGLRKTGLVERGLRGLEIERDRWRQVSVEVRQALRQRPVVEVAEALSDLGEDLLVGHRADKRFSELHVVHRRLRLREVDVPVLRRGDHHYLHVVVALEFNDLLGRELVRDVSLAVRCLQGRAPMDRRSS